MYTPLTFKKRGRYGNNHWFSYSPKLKRLVNLYSDLERDHWILIETDPNIETFCEQPLKITHSYKGNIVSAIFDMWVQQKDGTQCFIEIKYSNSFDLSHPKYDDVIKQTEVQKAWCEEKGYVYQIKTENEIRKSPLFLENMKRILSFVKNENISIEGDCQNILYKIRQEGRLSASELEKSLCNISRSRMYEVVSLLYYQGKIQTNLDSVPFGAKMEVWYNE